MKVKTIVQGALHITGNPFDENEMGLMMIVHVQTHLLNGISDVRACQGVVL